MRPAFLHLDEALHGQPDLLEAGRAAGARSADARRLGPALRLWSRPKALDRLREVVAKQLPSDDGPKLVFAGSGDFHHVTPLLLTRALERDPGPVTLVHFDNHPDWVRFENGMHCGSWVNRAAALPGVAKVITLGVCSRDIERPERKGAVLSLLSEDRLELYPYRNPTGRDRLNLCGRSFPTIEAVGEASFLDLLLQRVATDAVYVTIDKDVLRGEDAVTNWDQGQASLEFVLQAIARLRGSKRLIGADVVGDYSAPVFGGGLLAGMLKRGEAWLDHPSQQSPSAHTNALNQAVNLRLLDAFCGSAA